MHLWQSIRGLVAGDYRPIALHDDPLDEKLPHWPRRSCLRMPRMRRVTVILLLIDVTIVSLLVYTLEPLITLLLRNEELFGPRFAVPELNATQVEKIEIPKILHQTSATDIIPESWIGPQQSCIKTYGDYEYMHWTDARARDFISKEYPWFLELWDNYAFPIQRADSIRYLVLYHFGGIYLDMDTLCKAPFPLDAIEQDGHYALFKSTLPTGVTNDFMITTARHPVYAHALAQLPVFFRITQAWARFEPYAAIMLSSGPLFITLVIKDYLLNLPYLPSKTIEVIDQYKMGAYITDLESSSWHQNDTQTLMWLGKHPWTWYALGAIGVVVGSFIVNRFLLLLVKAPRKLISLVRSARRLTRTKQKDMLV